MHTLKYRSIFLATTSHMDFRYLYCELIKLKINRYWSSWNTLWIQLVTFSLFFEAMFEHSKILDMLVIESKNASRNSRWFPNPSIRKLRSSYIQSAVHLCVLFIQLVFSGFYLLDLKHDASVGPNFKFRLGPLCELCNSRTRSCFLVIFKWTTSCMLSNNQYTIQK